MIEGQTGLARQNIFDRSPLPIAVTSTTGSQAPGTDIGAAYTVPASRKFLLTGVLVALDRITAAAPVGEVSGRLEVSIQSGAFAPLIYAIFNNNTVGANAFLALSPQMTMIAGDRIRWVTFDGSTGGTCYRIATYSGVEFDA